METYYHKKRGVVNFPKIKFAAPFTLTLKQVTSVKGYGNSISMKISICSLLKKSR